MTERLTLLKKKCQRSITYLRIEKILVLSLTAENNREAIRKEKEHIILHNASFITSLVIWSSILLEPGLRSNIRCYGYGIAIWQHIVFLICMK
jgi:hypothetical protein